MAHPAALADLARHAHALGTHGAGDAARHAVVELQLFMLISLCDASEPDTAIELATVMSRDAARIAGHEDAHALNILAVQVLCLAHTGRTAEGVALGGRVAAELERLLGPEHPDALTAWLHVAANHWNGGQPDPAIEIAERVHALHLANQGAEAPVHAESGAVPRRLLRHRPPPGGRDRAAEQQPGRL